jgi:hypothetical protein
VAGGHKDKDAAAWHATPGSTSARAQRKTPQGLAWPLLTDYIIRVIGRGPRLYRPMDDNGHVDYVRRRKGHDRPFALKPFGGGFRFFVLVVGCDRNYLL